MSSEDPDCVGLFGPFHQDYLVLARYGDILDDLENTRMANANRYGALARAGAVGSAEANLLADLVEGLEHLEHQATLGLSKAMRRHPLGPWVKRTVGIGEKQGARLLAAIGDPYWNAAADRPRRGPAELWAYCGLHVLESPGGGVAARRQKGQRSNWNGLAKSRVWLIAGSCVKQVRSPYREVYDKRRAATLGRVHQVECVRCGPSGHPALPGSPWPKAHQHADALRVVGKAVLRDLWVESREAHRKL